ncbi:YebC-like protein [Sodiomyces alkalinus F11]|uniref:YebC-like protein n=1 Tax=Sodiomyces alkalinus (strain CBS 110278 / VKM F-3762 / F11) TaxID=1314773 RepID=A0A3N2PMW6_SODAK|nr:YebC-like protein [Sodiomyces alkalinus F11]ROT35871.1 YebC-like protein [Sodiomyces alkalinus F11]
MIALQSRLHGLHSAQLATAVAAAKKAGVPKNLIESAVARGQGRSATGTALDTLTLEVIMPPGVALIVDIETDSRLRSLEHLKHLVKTHKGRVGSSAAFLFTRRGRVVFDATAGPSPSPSPSLDDVMEDAIEAGAEDLETDPDGNVVVWTQPSMTADVMERLAPRFGGRVLSSEIVWDANEETKVKVDSAGDAQALGDLLAALQESPEVQAVYANAAKGTISDEEWSCIKDSIDS